MPYTPQDWANSPATSTPLTAARLAHIETQYAEARADAVIDVAADVANPASGIGAALSATFVSVEGEPADGDAIIWDETAGDWVPAAVEGGGTALTVLSEAEGNTGTATTARAISAARLVQQIAEHAAAGPQGPAGADGDDGVGVPAGGSTGQVLAKASATDYDTEWADASGGGSASKNWIPGVFNIPGFPIIGANMGNGNFSWGSTNVYMVPFTITASGTATGLQVAVNNAGASGSTARIAIYTAGATNTSPHTLLLDAGTVAIDSSGLKGITISQALSAGRYLLAITASATFGPTYYACGALVHGIVFHEDYTSRRGLTTTMTYGAFPGTLTPSYMSGYAQPSESNIPVLIKLT